MTPHKILKPFHGSQTGLDFHSFEEGSVAHLSDDLAAIAVSEGWAEPVTAQSRETKVVEPEETKPDHPHETKRLIRKKK